LVLAVAAVTALAYVIEPPIAVPLQSLTCDVDQVAQRNPVDSCLRLAWLFG
jgi:hypothetical protein